MAAESGFAIACSPMPSITWGTRRTLALGRTWQRVELRKICLESLEVSFMAIERAVKPNARQSKARAIALHTFNYR